jgi:chemotaxis signal transduction protein
VENDTGHDPGQTHRGLLSVQQYFTFTVATHIYALPRPLVKDMLSRCGTPIHPLPSAPRHVIGTLLWAPQDMSGSRAIPVIALEPDALPSISTSSRGSTVIVVQCSGHVAGILADTVRTTRSISRQQLVPGARSSSGALSAYVLSTLRHLPEPIHVLDAERLLLEAHATLVPPQRPLAPTY